MFHPLELADGAAELVAHLGVVGGGGHRPVGDTRRLGGEQGGREIEDSLRIDLQHIGFGDRQSVRRRGRVATHHVVAGQVGDVEPVAGDHHEDGLVAIGCREQEQVAHLPAEDVPGLTVQRHHSAVPDETQRARLQGHRAEGRTVGQPGELTRTPGLVQDGTEQHGREEGTG